MADDKKELEELRQELDEVKDYINALLVLAKDFLPVCPDKARKMLTVAIEEGQKLRHGRIALFNRYREALQMIATGDSPGISDNERVATMRSLAFDALGVPVEVRSVIGKGVDVFAPGPEQG